MPRLCFTEFDAFADAVGEVSVRMRMCSRQVSTWTLRGATVGPLAVQNGVEGGGSIAEGQNAGETWSLYWQSHPVRVNGQLMDEDGVFAVPPGGEFCLACRQSHECDL